MWQGKRRNRALLFLSGKVGFPSARLTEDTATITCREEEESSFVAEPEPLRACCSRTTGSEVEWRRPCKKALRKCTAEGRRGASCTCMALAPRRQEPQAGRSQLQLLSEEACGDTGIALYDLRAIQDRLTRFHSDKQRKYWFPFRWEQAKSYTHGLCFGQIVQI